MSHGFLLSSGRHMAMRSMKPTASRSFARAMSSQGTVKADDAKAFYALGVNVARQVGGDIKRMLTKDELAFYLNGFCDSINNTAGDERAVMMSYGSRLNEILTQRALKLSADQNEAGESFIKNYLAQNPTAITTSSGLVYHETFAGTGSQPTTANTVTVHYTGTLADGAVFDSSANQDPVTFPLGNVIKGWQEGVALMKQGGKATLIIPAALGYGDEGSAPTIPPGATLIFDVDLIEVK